MSGSSSTIRMRVLVVFTGVNILLAMNADEPERGQPCRALPPFRPKDKKSIWHSPWNFTGQDRRWGMVKYLAGVLTVIAMGTLLIAYGLLNPRLPAVDAMGYPASYPASLTRPVSDRVQVIDSLAQPVAYRTSAPEIVERAP